MDVVIPVGLKDFYIVQKNIANINKFFDYENIYVISDKNSFSFFEKTFLEKNRVVLIGENDVSPGLSFQSVKALIDKKGLVYPSYGWYFQQFLKILFARSKWAKNEYLIWDADTIPLRHIDFKENDVYLFNLKEEHHIPYFDSIKKILGLEKAVAKSFITEHIVVDVAIMKEMLDKIEQNCGETVWEAIINCQPQDVKFGFSEYETYGTYIYSTYPNKVKFRDLKTYRDAGCKYGRGISKRNLEKLGKEYDTASFEAGHHPRGIHAASDIFFRIKQKIFRLRLAKKIKQPRLPQPQS